MITNYLTKLFLPNTYVALQKLKPEDADRLLTPTIKKIALYQDLARICHYSGIGSTIIAIDAVLKDSTYVVIGATFFSIVMQGLKLGLQEDALQENNYVNRIHSIAAPLT